DSKFIDSPANTNPNGGVWWEQVGHNLAASGQPNFKEFFGYTMGPGYYGKTFYMWPPDPRAPADNAAVAPPAAGESNPAARARGYVPGDWRIRFFQSPENINNWNTSGQWAGPQPDYTAVIKWIVGGPQVFPPNLRCGRCKYYDAI